jgi:hypothetical protein
LLLHSGGRLSISIEFSFDIPVIIAKSSSDIASTNVFIMCWLRQPSAQHIRKIPEIELTLSLELPVKLSTACIILVYVIVSAVKPADLMDLNAETAICNDFSFLS